MDGIVFDGCHLLSATPGYAPAPSAARPQPAPRSRRQRQAREDGRRARALRDPRGGGADAALKVESAGAPDVGPRSASRAMDEQGIDVEALSINPYLVQGRPRRRRAARSSIQNEKLAEFCAAHPDRFVAFASVALQHPDLAAEQLERRRQEARAARRRGRRQRRRRRARRPEVPPVLGQGRGARRAGLHPPAGHAPSSSQRRLKGNGWLDNVIGNPLETTIALSHLIFEGTLDKFPGLKICAAHGGGYLPSYAARSDDGADDLPRRMHGHAQEEADRIPAAALLRLDRVHAGGAAPPGRRGRREPDRDGHRLSVPVDEDRGRSHPRHAGASATTSASPCWAERRRGCSASSSRRPFRSPAPPRTTRGALAPARQR